MFECPEVSDKAMQPSVTWKYLKFEMCKRFEVAEPVVRCTKLKSLLP